VGIKRDAYYKHLKRAAVKQEDTVRVIQKVQAIRKDQPRAGTRKLHQQLKNEGETVGRDRLFTILRNNDMLVERKKRFQKTTYRDPGYAVAPNLIKELEISRPGQVLVMSRFSDIRTRRR
jgi:putative transposase